MGWIAKSLMLALGAFGLVSRVILSVRTPSRAKATLHIKARQRDKCAFDTLELWKLL